MGQMAGWVRDGGEERRLGYSVWRIAGSVKWIAGDPSWKSSLREAAVVEEQIAKLQVEMDGSFWQLWFLV